METLHLLPRGRARGRGMRWEPEGGQAVYGPRLASRALRGRGGRPRSETFAHRRLGGFGHARGYPAARPTLTSLSVQPPFATAVSDRPHLRRAPLIPPGAEELWGLAYRLRQRFPQLAGQEYLPKRFPVVSTQARRGGAGKDMGKQ